MPAASPPQGEGARNRGAGVLVAAAAAVAAAPIPPALVVLAACAAPADGRLCGELVTEMPTLDECPEGGGGSYECRWRRMAEAAAVAATAGDRGGRLAGAAVPLTIGGRR